MRGMSSILFLFRNEFNKFNDAGARVLDSILTGFKNATLG